MKVVIVDFGSGNLRSAAKAFERAARETGADARIEVSAEADAVRAADRIVLPGVSAFGDCKAGLVARPGMIAALEDAVIGRARPFLGICVGMQLMATRGLEHGVHQGLGWIRGEVARIEPADGSLKVPHMGWNEIEVRAHAHPLLAGLGPGTHMYFLHSYHMCCERDFEVIATAEHGAPLAAVVGRDNLAGVQFHPEKSAAAGLRLIGNFLGWKP